MFEENHFGQLDEQEQYALLRSILANPSSANWRRLLSLLEDWPEGGERAAVAYAAEHLQAWPDELRILPMSEEPDRLITYPHGVIGELLEEYDEWTWAAFELTTTLYLSCCELGNSIDALATFSPLHNLRYLTLTDCYLGDHDVRHIAESTVLSKLKSLDLCSNFIEVEGVRSLLSSKTLLELESLNLSRHDDLGDDGMSVFRNDASLPKLKTLDLSACGIEIEGVRTLAHSEFIGTLDTLLLSGNFFGDEGAEIIADSPIFSKLSKLELNACDIGSEGRKVLLNSPLSQHTKLSLLPEFP